MTKLFSSHCSHKKSIEIDDPIVSPQIDNKGKQNQVQLYFLDSIYKTLLELNVINSQSDGICHNFEWQYLWIVNPKWLMWGLLTEA